MRLSIVSDVSDIEKNADASKHAAMMIIWGTLASKVSLLV
jgi:hypothetical protein